MQVGPFLARHPPFDSVVPEELERVARSVQIEFFPAGTTILRQAGEPARFLYVVRTGAVELLDEGRVLDLLGEGEAFGHPSLLSGLAQPSRSAPMRTRSATSSTGKLPRRSWAPHPVLPSSPPPCCVASGGLEWCARASPSQWASLEWGRWCVGLP